MNAQNDNLTPDEAEAFRSRCRAFLEEHATGIVVEGKDPRSTQSLAQARAYQAKVAAAGLAGLTYPVEFGGQGLTKAHDRIWREESGKFPDMTGQLTITHGMCLPMMAEYASDELKSEHLAKMISAEEVFCQMFSEPGAGSDVASLQTRAVLDGDEWTINGQKVWTTLAHHSDYGILIARTDPTRPKHQGITMFMVDMNAPGVEVRAINQIDGGQHFNEIFFTDLRIPKSWQIGPLNEGWRLATSMLMYERVAIGTGSTNGIKTPNAKWLMKEAAARGLADDPLVRQRLMWLYSQEAAKSLVAMRTRAEMKAGKTPGPGGSLSKLHGAVIAKALRGIIADVFANGVMAWEGIDTDEEKAARSLIGTYASTIAGGTDEIQRNIIGDRVLGLPREPSVDKDLPFGDLMKSRIARQLVERRGALRAERRVTMARPAATPIAMRNVPNKPEPVVRATPPST
ncbi:MAG: acyl-CoA dehydrogenase family protein [Acidimicrobiales bacterium]